MIAGNSIVKSHLEGVKQYIVPLFQRPYSWTKREWETLWLDIVSLYDEPRSHFFGSIVTMQENGTSGGISKFTLIDGQQRLTTISILLLAIRDYLNKNNESFANEINDTYICNPYKKGIDAFKLLPTQQDRDSYVKIVCKQDLSKNCDAITDAYNFFLTRIKNLKEVDLSILVNILLEKFEVVSVGLDSNDNPYLVFEGLNAKGKKLSSADLIRNYVLMNFDNIDTQQEVYIKKWKPMEDLLGDSVTEFVRHFLMTDGSEVKQDAIYEKLKNIIHKTNVLKSIDMMCEFAKYYKAMNEPETEEDSEIKTEFITLKKMEMNTSFPFILKCYHDYKVNYITKEEFLNVLKVLQNYAIRRFVCGLSTNQLSKIFTPLYKQMAALEDGTFVDRLKQILKTKNYPKDRDFIARLKDAALYGKGARVAKTKVILDLIEKSYKHKESPVLDKCSIEHIMPQNLSQEWHDYIGENATEIHEVYLNTLGNLTLTGYNSEASNALFSVKKKIYADSNLRMNRYFAEIQKWNDTEINRRAENLIEVLLKECAYFGGEEKQLNVSTNEVTFTKPKSVTFLGEKHETSSWREVMEKLLNFIIDIDIEKFMQIVENYNKFVGKTQTFRSAKKLKNGYYFEGNISASGIKRFCDQVVDFIELDQDDFKIDFE